MTLEKDNQLCTDGPNGFKDVNSEYITWNQPTKNVKKVQLVFRDESPNGSDTGHAQIADMKIHYLY